MAAAELYRDLVAAGFELSPAPDGRLEVRPRDRLTDDLRASIRAHRDELLRMLAVRCEWGCGAVTRLGAEMARHVNHECASAAAARDRDEPAAAATTTWPSPVCAACETTTAIAFLEMVPGADGAPWWLCGRCWRTS
jgi:hypothetical protein